MSWKHVLNGDKGDFKNCVEVSSIAGKMGYKFSCIMELYISEMKLLRAIMRQEL